MINTSPKINHSLNSINLSLLNSKASLSTSNKSKPFLKQLTISEALDSVGPLKRISSRRTRSYQAPERKRIVFEGHGECQANSKKVKVPDATTFTLHTGLNCVLLERAAIAIANDVKTPSSLRFKGTDCEGFHEADIFGGRSYLTGHRRTFYGGEMVTNFLLYPPSLNMVVAQDSITTEYPISLKNLLNEHRGNDCHWVACTIIRP